MIDKTETFQALCPIVSRGDYIAWAAGSGLAVYNTASKRIEKDVSDSCGHYDAIRSIAFDSTGNRLVTAGEDKRVIVWDRDAGWWRIERSFLHSKKLMVVLFDSDDNVVFGDKFGEFFRFKELTAPLVADEYPVDGIDEDEGRVDSQIELLFGHLAAVSCAIYSEKLGLLISADRDEKIRLSQYPKVWLIESFLFGHRKYVSSLAFFGGDETKIVSAGADGMVILWDISDPSNPKQVWSVSVGDGPINSIAVDGSRVLVVKTQEPDRVTVIENGEITGELTLELPAQSIHVTPTASIVAVGSNSHLMTVGGTTVRVAEDVPGIPISLMKVVHHENLDIAETEERRNKKSRKAREENE